MAHLCLVGASQITNWGEIERLAIAGMTDVELGEKFGIKPNTVRKRRIRHNWLTPLAIAKRAAELEKPAPGTGKDLVQIAAEDWNAKGEAHRKTAFDIAHESIKKFQVKPPRNFRELKAADDIARRAAGLDISEVNQQTLIMMHERVNSFDGEQEQPEEIGRPVIEAEVVTESLPQPESHSEETTVSDASSQAAA